MDVMQATPPDPRRSKRHPMRTDVLTCASRSWGVLLSACWGLWGGVLAAGCTASAEDVHPPQDQLFFPTGLAVAPDSHAMTRSVLFAANSNSELRYDSGAISVIDLDVVQRVLEAWSPLPGSGGAPSHDTSCSPDPDHRETLVCDAPQSCSSGGRSAVNTTSGTPARLASTIAGR